MINSKNFNYLIFFLFIGLWSSIGSDPYNFLFIFEKKNNFNLNISNMNLVEIINFLRAFFPLFCLAISLIIIIKYRLFKKQKKFIYILLFIQIIQIITTFFSKNSIMSNFENSIDHIGRYHWTISSIASILLFMIASKLKNFDMRKIFYISIFFLILMVFWFSKINLTDFFLSDLSRTLYHLNVLRDSAIFLDHDMPRITGLSRSIIFLYIVFFFLNESLNNKFKYLNYVLLTIFGSLIFLYQSKFAVVSFVLINFIFLFNFVDKSKGARIILTLLIVQIFLFYTISNSRLIFNKTVSKFIQFQVTDMEDRFTEIATVKEKNKINHFRNIFDKDKKGFELVQHAITSGRYDLWRKSMYYIKERPFSGYGSMSDRIIINLAISCCISESCLCQPTPYALQEKNFDLLRLKSPVSNAFIYSLLSGGVFSLILFIYFWLNIRKKIINIFTIKHLSNNGKKIGTVIIFVIGLRCLVENSIMIFGVDYLLILNSLYLTEKE